LYSKKLSKPSINKQKATQKTCKKKKRSKESVLWEISWQRLYCRCGDSWEMASQRKDKGWILDHTIMGVMSRMGLGKLEEEAWESSYLLIIASTWMNGNMIK
jgi:hypothetical protein